MCIAENFKMEWRFKRYIYLPSDEELCQELEKGKNEIEMERKLNSYERCNSEEGTKKGSVKTPPAKV